jgi:hypothetical protein
LYRVDADELAFLAEYRRRGLPMLSLPHFAHLPLRVRRGAADVLQSLVDKGFLVEVPEALLPMTYRLTKVGVDHCGGLATFVR